MTPAIVALIAYWMVSILVLAATIAICLGYIADKLKRIAEMMERRNAHNP